MPDETDLKLPSPSPSWPELNEFIDKQSKDARDTINFWFKLAAGLLGLIIVAAGLFGWKSLRDVEASAEEVARTEAIRQVRILFEQPEIQQVARDTAARLFEEGAYRAEIQKTVRSQIKNAVEGAIVGQYVVRINGVANQNLQINRRVTPKSQ